MTGKIRSFGSTRDGQEVSAIDLKAGELSATILTYGATLQDIRLAGVPWPLTLGGNSVAAYEGPMRYFGAIAGPVANRIANASVEIGGVTHRLDANEGGRTTLHGGRTGTSQLVWEIDEANSSAVRLSLKLADGHGGFPGERRLTAVFRIAPPSTLVLELHATADRTTIINLANHSYWNLDGAPDTSGQTIRALADRYTPVDDALIPTGAVADVSGTAFDLRAGHTLRNVAAFDHNFCVASDRRPLTPVVELLGRRGVRMSIASTEPGVQIYDGRGIGTGTGPGLSGSPYGPFAGIAIEPQCWPDAPHHAGFPPIFCAPDRPYRQVTEFGFERTTTD